jgi:hypothetical protein
MLIERGRIVDLGEPRAIAREYNELNFGRLVHTPADGAAARYGDRRVAEVVEAWFENEDGERVIAIGQGERLRACFEVAAFEPLVDPVFAITLRNDAQHTIYTARSDQHRPTGAFAAGDRFVVTFGFENWLAPSRYSLSPSIARAGAGADALDVREDLAFLMVHGDHTGGVVNLPYDLEVRPT